MIDCGFEDIDISHLNAMKENSVREGISLDYKLLPTFATDDDKKEFLADVSSFANTLGGDLVFGVEELRDTAGNSTGEVGDIVGVAGNIDDILKRLEDIIRTCLEPRLVGARLKTVGSFKNGPVIVLRIPQSMVSPHIWWLLRTHPDSLHETALGSTN